MAASLERCWHDHEMMNAMMRRMPFDLDGRLRWNKVNSGFTTAITLKSFDALGKWQYLMTKNLTFFEVVQRHCGSNSFAFRAHSICQIHPFDYVLISKKPKQDVSM
jgi:hypothetical protein